MLEGEKSALVVAVDNLRSAPLLDKTALASVENNLDSVQQWIYSQMEVLGTFRGMHGASKSEEMELMYKSYIAEEESTVSTLLQGL